MKLHAKCIATVIAIALVLFCAISDTFAQTALAPTITKDPVASSTLAKSAKLMLYVQAMPRDAGILTYQWYRTTDSVPTNVVNSFSLPPTEAQVNTIKSTYGWQAIAGATKATLEIQSPNAKGYFYYGCVVTNTNSGVSATAETKLGRVQVIDKTLYDELKNGGFQEYYDFNGKTAGGSSTTSVEMSPSMAPSQGSAFALVPLDAADVQKGMKYWNTTHAYNTNAYSAGKVSQVMVANSMGSNNCYLDTTGHSAGYIPGDPAYYKYYYVVELCADEGSSLYQEIATVPGKIYEWSLDHAPRSRTTSGTIQGLEDVMSVIIGPAINARTDYGTGVTNRWTGPTTYTIGTTGGTNNQYNKFSHSYLYPYGNGNNTTYFNDVVNSMNLGTNYQALSGTPRVAKYNNSSYYVYISYANRALTQVGSNYKLTWTPESGAYSVPEGQGITVFSFVSQVPGGNSGNVLDNIVFKSGNTPVSASAMFYSGHVSLSVATQGGYTYGITEVRGSSVTNLVNDSVTFCTGKDCTGGSKINTNNFGESSISNWYYPNAAGNITFNGLVPGKTYRIIGIPRGAISSASQLNTNTSPAQVLDDGYYTEITIPAAWIGNEVQMATATASAVSEDKARIFVTNTNSDAEYALVDSITGAVVYTWTSGLGINTGAALVFNNVDINRSYIVVARPKGYNEISYAEAAVLSPTGSGIVVRTPGGINKGGLEDILRSQVSRTHSGATDIVTVTGIDSRGEYGIYDPSTGYFIGNLRTGADGSTMVFPDLDPTKIYHIAMREKGVTNAAFMVGVRVYPYAAPLYINYEKEWISSAGNNYISKEVEYRMKALDKNATWLIGNGQPVDTETADTWAPASGTSQLALNMMRNGGASILDSMKTLKADTAIFYYRMHPVEVDGWVGPSIAPESDPLKVPRRPDKPVRSKEFEPHNYEIDYRDLPEALAVTADSTAVEYSLDNGTYYTLIEAGDSVLLTTLGWTEAERVVPLRFPFVEGLSFASDTTMQLIAGRGPAPVGIYAEIYEEGGVNNIRIIGLNTDTTYQYKLLDAPDTKWITLTGTNTIQGLEIQAGGNDYEIRYAPSYDAPASMSQVLSVPLSVVPVNWNVGYGYDPESITQPVTIRNVEAEDHRFDSIELTGGDAARFILTQVDTAKTVPGMRLRTTPGQNQSYAIAPVAGLNVGNYRTKLLLTYGTSTATADVVLDVVKVKWPNTLTATYTNPKDTSFHVDITGAPSGAVIRYGINATDSSATAGGVVNRDFTKSKEGLIPASSYQIFYRIAEDDNHYASDINILTAYTAYSKDSVVYVDYMEEMLKPIIRPGLQISNYQIKINDTEVKTNYQVSTEAEEGFTVSIVRTGPDTNIPPSEPYIFTVAPRPPAPVGITTTQATNTIALAGNFQFRAAGNMNIMLGWAAAINSVSVANKGTYEVRYPATATKFASKFTTVYLDIALKPKNNKVLYVDIARIDGQGAGDGSSWVNATPSFAAALQYADTTKTKIDSIYVAIGTYYPQKPANGRSTNERDRAFVIPANLKISGGYDAVKSIASGANVKNSAGESSILSGDIGAEGNNSDNAYHVVIVPNYAGIVMEGFVITGGTANTAAGTAADTIRVNGQDIRRSYGGGIYTAGANARLKLVNILIHSNTAYKGAGIYINNGIDSLINATISGNYATNTAGGICRETAGNVALTNTIVYGNTAASSDPEISGTNITYKYSLAKGITSADGNGNLSGAVDPLYVDAAANNYRLQYASPAREKGSNSLYIAARSLPSFDWQKETDVAGRYRMRSGTIDLGAYEYQPAMMWISSGTDVPENNLWSTASNWLDGVIPTEVDSFSYAPTAKDLYVDGRYTVLNITNATSSNLIIKKNAALKLTATLPGKNTALDFKDPTSHILRANSFDNDDDTRIDDPEGGRIFVESGDTTGVNGSLIIPKGSYAKATFNLYSKGVGPVGATNTNQLSWQYFGVPVKNFLAYNMTGGYVRKFYETGKDIFWEWVDNSEVIQPTGGYEISRILPHTGFFNITGEVFTKDTLLTRLSVTNTSPNTGQHIVSNPYPAGLSIRNGLEFGDNMQKTAYLFHTGSIFDWESTVGTSGTAPGQYLSVPQQQAGIGGIPDAIASMQGFLVKVDLSLYNINADLSRNNLRFKYDNLLMENAVSRSDRDKAYTAVILSETGGNVKDKFWLFVDPDATYEYDNGYDGYKLFGASKLARFYTQWEGQNYQISTQPGMKGTWLYMKAEENVTDYTLTFHTVNLKNLYTRIYLLDTETGTKTDIRVDSSTYRFTATNTDVASRRFQLITEGGTSIPPVTTKDLLDVYGYKNNIVIDNGCEAKATVQVYDVQGRLLHGTEVSGNSREIISGRFTSGFYVVRVIAGNCEQMITKKIMIYNQ